MVGPLSGSRCDLRLIFCNTSGPTPGVFLFFTQPNNAMTWDEFKDSMTKCGLILTDHDRAETIYQYITDKQEAIICESHNWTWSEIDDAQRSLSMARTQLSELFRPVRRR